MNVNVEKKFCVERDRVEEVVEDSTDDSNAGVDDREKCQHLEIVPRSSKFEKQARSIIKISP